MPELVDWPAAFRPILARVQMSPKARERCENLLAKRITPRAFWDAAARDAWADDGDADPRPFSRWRSSASALAYPLEPSEHAYDPSARLERVPRPPRGSDGEERSRIEERAVEANERNRKRWIEYHSERWRIEVARTNAYLTLARWRDAVSEQDGAELVRDLDEALSTWDAWKPKLEVDTQRARNRALVRER